MNIAISNGLTINVPNATIIVYDGVAAVCPSGFQRITRRNIGLGLFGY
jgi:hypothetical protein